MDNRDFELAAALVAPEGGRRGLSAGSLLVLEMLGNGLAALDVDGVSGVSGYEVAEFVWVHEAPLERVRAAAVLARKRGDVVRAQVLEWAEAQSPEVLAEWRACVREEVVRATAALAVHERGGESKNGCGPCSR